jgi:hypothetical protein
MSEVILSQAITDQSISLLTRSFDSLTLSIYKATRLGEGIARLVKAIKYPTGELLNLSPYYLYSLCRLVRITTLA